MGFGVLIPIIDRETSELNEEADHVAVGCKLQRRALLLVVDVGAIEFDEPLCQGNGTTKVQGGATLAVDDGAVGLRVLEQLIHHFQVVLLHRHQQWVQFEVGVHDW